MKPSPYPDWLDAIWAKSVEKGEGGMAESLAQHTWAVLQRLADFARLRPALPAQVGRPDLWLILFWAAVFHDFGKAITPFQGVLRGDTAARSAWQGHRHEVFSLAFIDWIAPALSADQLAWVALAVLFHHRDPAEIDRLYPAGDDGEEDLLTPILVNLETDTLCGLWRWLAECIPAWADNLGLNGVDPMASELVSQESAVSSFRAHAARAIRNHLKNSCRFLRALNLEESTLVTALIMLRGYVINADHSASAHIRDLPALRFTTRQVIEASKFLPGAIYPHQACAAKVEGSALLTAPTGSGKTEAALFWAAGQQIGGNPAPRLFYTLPYQASMNAMSLRLKGIFGESNVGLQHGRALLALYRQLMERDDAPLAAVSTARRMRNLADLNYPPVRIFSPYQMLKAMYRLKGYEAQLMDYHNALFVFDEIHAYEVNRLAMILKTIEYLRRNYGARFFVMSATFPDLVKTWLAEALDHPLEIRAEPGLFHSFQRHQIDLTPGDLLEAIHLDQIAADARAGCSVLVVCNLVARAQQAYRELKIRLDEFGIPVELLHGRFNMRDRSRKEALIRNQTGGPGCDRAPVVLVATQVVEVSLDIDLNTIYTDPAPLEALVQRFGRINRRRKMKTLALVHVFRLPADGQKIYDPRLIARTISILDRENGRPVDESAVGLWLNEIYSGEIACQWQRDYASSGADFELACVRSMRPFAADSGLEDQFYRAFDSIEVLPESLLDEYLLLMDETPILAAELLVPISWGRYHALAGQGRLKPRDRTLPPVVQAGYTSDLGLVFDSDVSVEEWD